MESIKSSTHLKAAQTYSYFASIEEMDQHVVLHTKTLKWNSTEHAILLFLAQHSLTYPGTSWVKVKNIAAAIGKSTRTVGYALTSLEQKNIIERIPVMREKRGGNSSNVIAILPFSSSNTLECRPSSADRSPSENLAAPAHSPAKSQTEAFSLESFKQDKKIYKGIDKFTWLMKCKWKDKQVRYGSSYMEKVVQTLTDEYEKIMYAKKQRDIRKHSTQIKRPEFDWLNEKNYSNFSERTGWL